LREKKKGKQGAKGRALGKGKNQRKALLESFCIPMGEILIGGGGGKKDGKEKNEAGALTSERR